MSIEKEIPTTKKVARAYKIEIDKSDKENPKIVCSYTNDDVYLGHESRTPLEVIEGGVLTAEEVSTIETLLKKVADAYNPYN